MISIERHGDVVRIRMSSVGSRAAGMDVSAYLTRGTLIDTGFPRARGQFARVLDALAAAGEHIDGAIVTHAHEDHAGNAMLLAARGVPLHLAALTLAAIRERPRIREYRRVVWGRPDAFTARESAFAHPALTLISTPGHSADHHVVWDAERATLFSGDLWLGVRSRVMHASESPRTIVASLRRVIALQPERMFDAHRGLVLDATQALTAKAEWLDDIIGAIDAKRAAGWSERAIVHALLGGEEIARWFSRGEYARRNLVRSVAAGR